MARLYSVQLLSKTVIADRTLDLTFSKPVDFTFSAGQFIQFEFAIGKEKFLRGYSIASAPPEEELRFCVRLVVNGRASGVFEQMKAGDTLAMSAALGVFGRDDLNPHKVLISTGTGLSPALSMILAETARPVAKSIKLLFGLRSEADIFWAERLAEIKKQNPRFDYLITLSRPTGAWTGAKGRVTEYLPIETKMTGYYICGNVEMVKEARGILLNAGVNNKSIHLEIY